MRNRFFRHLISFPYIWALIIVLLVASVFSLYGYWDVARYLIRPSLVLIVVLLVAKPLSAVYGLMGTSGSIRVFFVDLIHLCVFFSGIYYWGFFKTAGVSYDTNQPHIDFGLFADSDCSRIERKDLFQNQLNEKTIVNRRPGQKEIVYEYESDGVTVRDTVVRSSVIMDEYHYQSIDYQTILVNTVQTFLMQEPTDLFAIASTYNKEMAGSAYTVDKQKTEQFHWILIFQILVGWIFFGVFISLLYNKFRYES